MSTESSYRNYKMTINLGHFHYYVGSQIYEIQPGKSVILPGLIYSLATVTLGWWGVS